MEVVQEIIGKDHVILPARNSRAGNVTLDQPDALRQSALAVYRLTGAAQHGGRAVHRVKGVAGICFGKANGDVRGTATEIENGRLRGSSGESLLKQRHVRLVCLGEISGSISACLLRRIHQFGFRDAFHLTGHGTTYSMENDE